MHSLLKSRNDNISGLGNDEKRCHNLKKERKKEYSDVAMGVNYGVALFLRWFKFLCNPETCII